MRRFTIVTALHLRERQSSPDTEKIQRVMTATCPNRWSTFRVSNVRSLSTAVARAVGPLGGLSNKVSKVTDCCLVNFGAPRDASSID